MTRATPNNADVVIHSVFAVSFLEFELDVAAVAPPAAVPTDTTMRMITSAHRPFCNGVEWSMMYIESVL